MKANEAPEKLYFGEGDKIILDIYSNRDSNEQVEYTHTDAFMKKVKEAFCKATCNGHPPRSTCTSLGTCKQYDEFIKAMKE